ADRDRVPLASDAPDRPASAAAAEVGISQGETALRGRVQPAAALEPSLVVRRGIFLHPDDLSRRPAAADEEISVVADGEAAPIAQEQPRFADAGTARARLRVDVIGHPVERQRWVVLGPEDRAARVSLRRDLVELVGCEPRDAG